MDKNKVIAEIERRMAENEIKTKSNIAEWGAIREDKELLKYLNSLPEGGTESQEKVYQPSDARDNSNGYEMSDNSGQMEDLEKELDNYFSNWAQGASDEGCFNADSQLVSIYDCHRIARHFAQWQKEQMMKDAVEGEVVKTIDGSLRVSSYIFKREGFEFGDKVKVIIVKEEEK